MRTDSVDPDECEAGLLGEGEVTAPKAARCHCRRAVALASAPLVLALLGVALWQAHPRSERTDVQALLQEFSMPKGAGVNLGGWFVLEDWLFSGADGKMVSSDEDGQGRCLPPLLHHVDKAWPSEGVLASRLNASFGSEQTAKIFRAHREEFFTKERPQNPLRLYS